MYGVLGGGVSGLAAAHYLLSKLHSVILFESSSRVGGWIRSIKNEYGHVFEHGPRSLRPSGERGLNTLDLISELGLSDYVLPIPQNHPAAQNRMIYVNKHLYTLPSSFFSLLFTKPPFTRPIISALLHDLRAPQKTIKDESIYDFVERRLGKEIADYAISPLICGICAGDAKEISVKFLLKSQFEAEQIHGSIIGGMLRNLWKKKGNLMTNLGANESNLSQRASREKWSVYSLEGGLETLPRALEGSIKSLKGTINLDSPCEAISFVDSKTVMVKSSGKTYIFDHIISSLPARKLAPLVERQHPQLSRELAAIPSVSVGVVNLQYEGRVINKDAFGFLVPSSENLPILGIVFDSCCFPNGDNTILTVMMGGRWFEKLFGKDPTHDNLLDKATRQAESILNIRTKPKSHSVSILKDCIPQYVLGHHERVYQIKSYIKKHKLPLSVIGSSYDGVSVNDAIWSAKTVVDELVK